MNPVEKANEYNEWYLDIVEKAGLSDKRYPIKGMNVWTPYGWKIMRFVDTYIRRLIVPMFPYLLLQQQEHSCFR